MKLISHMISISYSKEEDISMLPKGIKIDPRYKVLKIANITKLPKEEYEDRTILGEERSEGWIIKTHYVGKGINSPKKRYRIAFEPVLENNENINDFYLRIKVTNKDQEVDYLRYCPKNNLFFDTDYFYKDNGNIVRTLGLANDTAGRFFIEIIRKDNSVIEKTIPILVLPSSLSYEDYLKMIRELREIKEDIILNDKSKVGIGELWVTKKENIEKIIGELEKSINIINKNPISSLTQEYIKKSYNQINKMTSKTLIEKSMYPYKNSFTAVNYSENLDVYENRVIKYVLCTLKEKVRSYKEFYDDYIIEEKNNIKKVKDNFKQITNISVEAKRKEIKDKKALEYELIKRVSKLPNRLNVKSNCRLGIFKNAEIDDMSIKIMFDYSKKKFRLQFTSIGKNIAAGYSYFNEKEMKISKHGLKVFLYTNNIDEMLSFINIIEEKPINNLPTFIDMNINDYKREKKQSKNGEFYCNCIIYADGVKSIRRNYSMEEKIEFLKKYMRDDNEDEILGMLDSIVGKEEEIDNIQERVSYGEVWNSLEKRIDKMLSVSMFKNINDKQIYNVKLTQVFINNPSYRRIYKLIKELNNNILLLNMKSPRAILIKSTSDIYEIWCLFKIVQILIGKQKFTLLNHKEVAYSLNNFMELKEPFSEKQLEFVFEKKLLNGYILTLNLIYEGRVYYDGKKFKTPDYQFIYTLKDKLGETIIEKRAYLDAKYRNYDSQGEVIYHKDIKDVAIEKYIKTFEDTINEPICSMIVHSHNYKRYVDWGGDNIKREAIADSLKPHSYGAFYLVPSDISNLNKFLRLLSEYHLSSNQFRSYSICWECGEVEEINIETRLTYGKKEKYYYTCKRCSEFWVKNHCEANSGHKLIKHRDNYHLSIYNENNTNDISREGNDNINPWHLICPVCGDGRSKRVTHIY